MFSTSRDDKPAVHEKIKRRVQAFICEITQKGQQMGFETGGGRRINNEWHVHPHWVVVSEFHLENTACL